MVNLVRRWGEQDSVRIAGEDEVSGGAQFHDRGDMTGYRVATSSAWAGGAEDS